MQHFLYFLPLPQGQGSLSPIFSLRIGWRRTALSCSPCVAIVGGMNADACELLDCGVDALVPTVIDAASIEEVLANAERNFKLAAQRVFSLVSLGRKMGENQ